MKAVLFFKCFILIAIGPLFILLGCKSSNALLPSNQIFNILLEDNEYQMIAKQSLKHFRSKQNGDWHSILTWEQSEDMITWYDSNSIPNSSSNTIIIQDNHTVTIFESIDISQLIIYGYLEIAGSPLTVYLINGDGNDLVIADGGVLKMSIGRSGGWNIYPDANWKIEAGGTYIHNSTRSVSTPMNSLSMEEGSNFVYLGNSDLVPSVALAGKTYYNLNFESEYGDWSLVSAWGEESLIINGSLSIGEGVILDLNDHPGLLDLNGDLLVSGNFIPGDLKTYAGNSIIINDTGVLEFYSEEDNSLSCEIINANGPSGLLLRSDATGSASLIHYGEGVEATVERYIPGDWSHALAGWHLISSPVSGQSIDDFVTQGAGNDYDFYGWDEASNSWINQKSNDFTTWNQGSDFNAAEGYLISYEQSQTDLAFKGVLHVNNVHLNELSYNTGKGGDPGWHLLGNPFASAIDWNDGQGWMLQNIQGQPQIWNNAMQDYEPVNIIPAMNGFMIRVSDPQDGTHSGSITIPADLRQHDTGHWYKSNDDNTQHIRLQVTDLDHGTAKSSTLRFHPEASSDIDRRDTYFLSGNGPGFYSLADNTRLSVNVLPERHPELRILLGFEKNRGNRFLLEVTEQIPGQDLYLFDRKLDNAHKLCSEHPYPFTAFDDDEPLRFELHFQPHGMGTDIRALTAKPYVQVSGQTLQLDFTASAPGRSLEVFDTSGRRLMHQGLNEARQHSINLNLTPGVYLIRIAEPGNITTQRILITQ